jgi:hypothetical protein
MAGDGSMAGQFQSSDSHGMTIFESWTANLILPISNRIITGSYLRLCYHGSGLVKDKSHESSSSRLSTHGVEAPLPIVKFFFEIHNVVL